MDKIESAIKLLRENGYFVDNLWQTCDVTMNYDCTEEEAHEVLLGAFNNESVYQTIWDAISSEAEYMKLKHVD